MYIKHEQSQRKENSYKPLTFQLILLAESEIRDNSHRRAVFNVLMYIRNSHESSYV